VWQPVPYLGRKGLFDPGTGGLASEVVQTWAALY